MQITSNRPLTLREAADALGLSVYTLRAWTGRKQIKHVRLGRAIRILPGVIEELLRKSTVDVPSRTLESEELLEATEDSQAIDGGR